ncbi:hypothetical protein KAT08_01645 [Candidatus Babeliales bacterium]|nr:hypothetical protein [Candidatus Babeliales bacterium]
MTNNVLIPTQLFVGPQDILNTKTIKFLQNIFCLHKKNDCFCTQCRKIKNNQHELLIWLNPDKDYKVQDIQIIFEKTNFALDKHQKFFFILQKANTLNLSSANRLLKILEEPPEGYNFILHTDNINSILPTIISRCHIVNFGKKEDGFKNEHPIASFFYDQKFDSPYEFDKELKKHHLSANESIQIANEMMAYYSKKIILHYKNQKVKNLKHLEKVLEFIKKKIKRPPQSGSSNLFWKNLYISFPKQIEK